MISFTAVKSRSEENSGPQKMNVKVEEPEYPTKVKELHFDCEFSKNTWNTTIIFFFCILADSEVESKLQGDPEQPTKVNNEDEQVQSTRSRTDESDCKFSACFVIKIVWHCGTSFIQWNQD